MRKKPPDPFFTGWRSHALLPHGCHGGGARRGASPAAPPLKPPGDGDCERGEDAHSKGGAAAAASRDSLVARMSELRGGHVKERE